MRLSCNQILSLVPHWVLNEYENHDNDASKETNLSELIRTHLRGRVKLRLAGDLHHYTRHIPLNDKWAGPIKLKSNGEENPLLIVSGGGGAVSSLFYNLYNLCHTQLITPSSPVFASNPLLPR